MGQYFYDVMKKEDLERLPYLPTIADLMEQGIAGDDYVI